MYHLCIETRIFLFKKIKDPDLNLYLIFEKITANFHLKALKHRICSIANNEWIENYRIKCVLLPMGPYWFQ